ncbi:pathogenesis-related protein PRB1-3-like [Aplysia californica]|uniref:Pathogenesis-related protein PRB1-3-like n=1 Tax=Aplysia californica TaxID=6500 RepID=A0ABM0ZZ50_APLCA|nr:pathogenesis-related protein PRB1-3-like [Aplysia californica]
MRLSWHKPIAPDSLPQKQMFTSLIPCMFLVSASSANVLNLSNGAIKKFVDLHNQYRKETGAGLPDLTWSQEMACYAAKLASKCKFAHDPAKKYGENIYMSSQKLTDVKAAMDSSASWRSEKSRVAADNWDCAYDLSEATTCGHYSQQVWKATKEIGCGVSVCDSGTMVFCEYKPAGNVRRYDPATGKTVNTPPY